MAKKPYEGSGSLPGMEPEGTNPSGRARAPRVSSPQPALSKKRLAIGVIAAGVTLVAMLFAFHSTEQFLIRDPRFALNGPEGSAETPTLDIRGSAHASRRALQAVFYDDMGRSVYLMPLSDRRATLRAVDWVKDASVARVWPNRVLVQIAERKPVAFIEIGSSRFALIDDDGVVLPVAEDRFHLPVLKGVRPSDSASDRRERVRRMMKLVGELGGASDQISEIDVSDRDNLKVTQPYDGRAITLLLGDQDYAIRYRNFLNHYGEIRQKLPGASTLDLRLEDRITVVDQE